MKRSFRLARVAAIGLVALALACTSDRSNSVTGPQGGTASIAIAHFAFSPAADTVAVGTTITWTNQDATAHTVTQDGGGFDSGSLAQNATFSQTFATKGTFSYHCRFHSSMVATVTVQ